MTRVENARRREQSAHRLDAQAARGACTTGAVGDQADGARAPSPARTGARGAAKSSNSDGTPAESPVAAAASAIEPPAPRAGETERLLRRYRRKKTVPLRDELVERHRAVVEAMARRLSGRLPPCVDAQDLVHAGIWGLMQAIDKFEPTRCEVFATFARIRVRGAMLDELRNMDFLPRLYRRRQRDREQALLRLRAELLREPSEQELAAQLGVTPAMLQRSYARRGELQLAGTVLDADDEAAWDAMDLLADDQVESPIEAIAQKELVAEIKKSLQPIEWKVLQLHYLEGMSGKEVARRLRLSASRICQIHGRVLDRLKQRWRAAAV